LISAPNRKLDVEPTKSEMEIMKKKKPTMPKSSTGSNDDSNDNNSNVPPRII
jgi:hypothetical protein